MAACACMSLPASPGVSTAKEILKEQSGLQRSQSSKDMSTAGDIGRSYSDNTLCYSNHRIRALSKEATIKASHSLAIFPRQVTSSIVPNALKSVSFELVTSQDGGVTKTDDDGDAQTNIIGGDEEEKDVQRANWVEKLLEIRSKWRNGRMKEEGVGNDDDDENVPCDCDKDGCVTNYGSEEENHEDEEKAVRLHARCDRESFSRLLVKVSWSETKQFALLAYLCNMAYTIPEIKDADLRRYYNLQFVTSSLSKKAKAATMREKLEQCSTCVPGCAGEALGPFSKALKESEKPRVGQSSAAYKIAALESDKKHEVRSSAAHKIAASAASYIQSRAKDLLSLSLEALQESSDTDSNTHAKQTSEVREEKSPPYKSAAAAHAAASTMTALVAADEKEKQEAARDLQSLQSAPCEWFVCDDISTYTRYFVIQGSDSLASWQANLFFEPTIFEGTDVLVHRGIYEAAKGIYEQFTPEIMQHLQAHGDHAKFQFTGHSLGGSLSLLVFLMLLTRKVVKPSALKPIVSFGSPFVFCGGQRILRSLGLDEHHVHCVMMHRDIVPRAFSCSYPNHVALLLKRLNGAFASHPCLNKDKLLYSPLGKIFILQPHERSSPSHPLLPPGNALYALDRSRNEYSTKALKTLLNCPHPLETLSDPTAYGSEGSILRDHESGSYLKAVNGVLKQHMKLVVRRVRKQRKVLWPLLISSSQPRGLMVRV